jgi:hypothetical protein
MPDGTRIMLKALEDIASSSYNVSTGDTKEGLLNVLSDINRVAMTGILNGIVMGVDVCEPEEQAQPQHE